MSNFEIRSCPFAELRVETTDDRRVIRGRAVVFDSLSVDMGGWREIIRPGAFTATLGDGHDIKALIEHNSAWIIGSTRAGTLTLTQTDDGLDFECSLPNTTYANDLAENLRVGNVYQCSFGFEYIDKEVRSDDGGPLIEVRAAKLFEVSCVTFPAYEATEVSLRSVEAWRREQDVVKGTPNLDRAKRLLKILDADC